MRARPSGKARRRCARSPLASTRPSRSSSRLLRSQDEFVADASHELRTPLTALRLRLESLPPSRDRDAALHEADRLRDLVDGLLALARADSGAEGSARVDAAALVRERVDAWLPLADEHRVALRRRARRAAAGARRPGPARPGARQPRRQRARGVAGRRRRSRCRLARARRGSSSTSATKARGSPPSSGSAPSTASGAPAPARAARASGSRSCKRLVAADDGEVELREAPERRHRRRRPAPSCLNLYRSLPGRSPAVCRRSRRTEA